MIDRRLKVADMTGQGMTPEQIKEELGYSSTASVYKAQAHPAVNEQIKWHRDNLFEQSRIDRVKLLRELYQRATEPTGPIFATLQGPDSDTNFLLASNLPKLDDFQSRLIQQIEMGSALVFTGETDEEGTRLTQHVSIVTKIRFHSPDSALKILSKAAGFEDGVLADQGAGAGGPFRGLVIIPPGSKAIDIERSGEGPPENPIDSPS